LIAFGRRQYAKASTHVQAALRRFRLERGSAGRAARADKDYWISIMHVTLGNIAVVRGDESLDAGRKTAAFRHYQTALAWYRQVKADSQLHTRRHTPGSGYCDRWDARLARTYGNLGELYYRLGDRHAALRHFQEGYDRARSLGLPNTLGACLLGRGLLMWEDDPVEAAGLLRQGLQEIDRLGKPPLMGKRLIEQARSLLDLTRVAVNQARAGG
jgi:tetratricopeptide (TPR) repeat protein